MPSRTDARTPGAHARAADGTLFPVNIGRAAALSGISAKMLRHYESLDLLGTVTRTDSGYRQYSQGDVHTLRFIKRARDLGFSMAEIAELVDLWRNRVLCVREERDGSRIYTVEVRKGAPLVPLFNDSAARYASASGMPMRCPCSCTESRYSA